MKILVVDDDRAVRDALRRALTLGGYEVQLAEGGSQALELLAQALPDAVVLDVSMPDIDGLEICRRLRLLGNRVPILILTARDAVADRIDGLDVGADDYMVKPFDVGELKARLRALLRRAAAAEDGAATEPAFAELRLDPARHGVVVGGASAGSASAGGASTDGASTGSASAGGTPAAAGHATAEGRFVELTRTEYQLLELLLRNPRQVLTHSIIYERVWGYDFGPSSNALRVYVGYLRRKLEQADARALIHNVRGIGYVLREP
jgi:two-component system response regulator MprA